ncbi:uncharacterized protein LOC129217712 [Uloborus diversus]|uniref:uncharacterized protein LOC129217712 n=1 Tax=Uloborus diversus TaxID=327109 RepID=UPI0024094372|nr:uncharacterized protein LOC129217712 [Uloborus diversus]
MAQKISSGNIAFRLRRGQPDLLGKPSAETGKSVYRADFKEPPLPPPPTRGKRRELLERFLFEKISADIAAREFRPRSPPSYRTCTQDHFDVAGFDPDAGLRPSFEHALYSEPQLTFWSDNRRVSHGVTVPDCPTGLFHRSAGFSKGVVERWGGGEDWGEAPPTCTESC